MQRYNRLQHVNMNQLKLCCAPYHQNMTLTDIIKYIIGVNVL